MCGISVCVCARTRTLLTVDDSVNRPAFAVANVFQTVDGVDGSFDAQLLQTCFTLLTVCW